MEQEYKTKCLSCQYRQKTEEGIPICTNDMRTGGINIEISENDGCEDGTTSIYEYLGLESPY